MASFLFKLNLNSASRLFKHQLHFDISWPAISQNLNVLCQAGLVTRRHAGHYRLYQANHAALGPIEPFLRAMWATDLDQLRAVVEQDAREASR